MRSGTALPVFFFFNDTATTEIYTLSLHDALPISHFVSAMRAARTRWCRIAVPARRPPAAAPGRDRKSTRLNSSHQIISYAVFCLKKKRLLKLLEYGPVGIGVDRLP